MNQRLVFFIAFVCIAQLGVTVYQRAEEQRVVTQTSQAPAKSAHATHSERVDSGPIVQRATKPQAPAIRSESLTVATPAATGAVHDSQPYRAERREERDPFVPFFAVRNNPGARDGAPLSQYELKDLRLTAIIRDPAGRYSASIETTQGRTFIVKKGTQIGTRGGEITEIAASKVIVAEPAFDRGGRSTLQFTEISMKPPPTPFGMSVSLSPDTSH